MLIINLKIARSDSIDPISSRYESNRNLASGQESYIKNYGANNLKLNYLTNKQNHLESIQKSMFYTPRNVSNKSLVLTNYMNNIPIVEEIDFLKENNEKNDADDINKKKNETLQAVDELTDNLELFKLEMTGNMRKIQRSQMKLRVHEVMDEITDFKDNFAKKIEETNKKREDDVNKIINEFSYVRNDFTRVVKDENAKNKDHIVSLKEELKNYQQEMSLKINSLEKKQKIQMEQMKHLMLNSDNRLVRKITQKMMSDNPDEFIIDRNVYIKPSKVELNQIVSDLKRKTLSKKKTLKKKDSIEEEKLMRLINKKKRTNKMINDDIQKEIEDTDMNYEKIKKEKLFDLSKNKFKEQFRRNVGTLKNSILEYDFGRYKMSKLNKFRSYVYAVLFKNKLSKNVKVSRKMNKLENLKIFVNLYSITGENLKRWVLTSTKTAFLSVKNFGILNLDLVDHGNYLNRSSQDMSDRFIKLQIRLNSFIDQLIDNLDIKILELDTILFLKVIITSGSFIPFNFFSLFELARLETTDKEIVNINENQKMMILSCYILIKIFLKYLLEESSQINNTNIRKNFKMIASVYYHTIIDYFKSACDIKYRIKSLPELRKKQDGSVFEYSESLKNENLKIIENTKGVDKSYIRALKKSTSKLNLIDMDKVEEKKLLSMINLKLPNQIDDHNDIQEISSLLYSYSDLENYFALAKERNFNLTDKVIDFSKKIMDLASNN